uniref:Protein broad-minded n=1 Tax=Anabas testudineus TaxID=64144 RepID=A0A3Q1J5H0_ANATE
MSQLSAEEGVELQTLLKLFLRSINDSISGAASAECAEEILLHLEETDKNFHNYEFVKFLRQYMERSLGTVVEEETKNLTSGDGQHTVGSGHDALIHIVTQRTRESAEYKQMRQTLKNTIIMAVEALINRFEEDQLKKEMHKEKQRSQSVHQFTDNCSDSDSSFNQSYAFIRQEQLQVLAEQLNSSRPKEVRWEALQALCCAPPSDVLSCESWSSLRTNLCAALTDPDLSDNVLQYFAKSFSSSPLNLTREIYTSLGRLFSVDITVFSSVFPQIRLINDFQKEVTTFWIRHPEKYMEEVIESTFSLLTYHHEYGSTSPRSEKPLEPIHLLALLDIKATWFKKWMHGYYSRTVVFRLLERKYKSLIVSALQQCIHYSECCERFTNETNDAESAEQQNTGKSVYSRRELEYAFFVHSVCVLGKLLIYTNGRKLFPIKVRKRKGVTLDYLLLCSYDLLFVCSDVLSPSSLVMEVLWMLCERTECAVECLHQTSVICTLLAPVIALLNGKSPAATLSLIADVLAHIANTDRGLALFLYENSLVTCAAHVVVQFTLRLLHKEFPSLSESDAYHTLCGAFIFVCRQIYNTFEGLQVLRPYGLHRALAAAWKQTSSLSERVPTPVPGAAAGASTQELQNMLIWEETLLDSLLNFSATPKGLLLLQQTGAINECVSYMFSHHYLQTNPQGTFIFHHTNPVQSSSDTLVGCLCVSGFVRALVIELWAALECGNEDVRVVRPKPTPMDPIDRSCLKSFLSMVNLLSSSQSVWELLGRHPLANKSEYSLREMPTSVPDLIDRLIAVNSDAKIHSLFHYEQSHTFGLRLLSVLCCNLDSFLLLESQYNICSMLLQSQKENVVELDTNNGEFIIDSLSVERNHVLVRVSVVGGSSERRLPPRALQEGEHPYPWPMFSSYPLPYCYTLDPPKIQQTSQGKTSADEVTDTNLYINVIFIYGIFIMSFLSFIYRYGNYLKLLKDDAVHNMTVLMKHVKIFLSTQRVKTSSELITQQDGYPGHDWLASTVFLIMAGDMDRSLSLLRNLSSLLVSAFIWPARIHASVHVPVEVAESGILPVYWCTAHYVEMLLKAEVPLVHSAFRMSGFTPSQMCLHWLTQCFWNYLDWKEICHYICTCVVMGSDYQVYLCVAIFKHLQPHILQRTQSQELQVFLKEEPIQGFKVNNYLEFMEGLERSYRNLVLTDMTSLRNPVE